MSTVATLADPASPRPVQPERSPPGGSTAGSCLRCPARAVGCAVGIRRRRCHATTAPRLVMEGAPGRFCPPRDVRGAVAKVRRRADHRLRPKAANWEVRRARVRESIAAGPRRRRSGGARVPGGSPRSRVLHPGSRSGAAHRAICAVRRGERRASDPVAALRDEVRLQEHGGHRRLERGDERPGGALEGDHLARELVEPDPGSRRSWMVDTPMLFGACEARVLSAGKRRLPRSFIAGMCRGPPWRTCRR